jgi:hypothetical protein
MECNGGITEDIHSSVREEKGSMLPGIKRDTVQTSLHAILNSMVVYFFVL